MQQPREGRPPSRRIRCAAPKSPGRAARFSAQVREIPREFPNLGGTTKHELLSSQSTGREYHFVQGALSESLPPCLSLWEMWPSEARTERVHAERDCRGPLSRLRRQLSQRESQGPMRIRTIQQVLMASSIDCTDSKATANKFDAILTGGAYQSARKVTWCE